MTIAQLAEAYGVKRARIYDLIRQGRLDQWVKLVKVNDRTFYVIDPAAVDHKPADRRKKPKDQSP